MLINEKSSGLPIIKLSRYSLKVSKDIFLIPPINKGLRLHTLYVEHIYKAAHISPIVHKSNKSICQDVQIVAINRTHKQYISGNIIRASPQPVNTRIGRSNIT